jgi:hypothetical protein
LEAALSKPLFQAQLISGFRLEKSLCGLARRPTISDARADEPSQTCAYYRGGDVKEIGANVTFLPTA